MTQRLLLIGLAFLVCLAFFSATLRQRGQLTALRAEQRRLLAESAAPPADSARVPAVEITAVTPGVSSPSVSSELLRLRGEVTRLARQRDELASVAAENQRLRAQAANRATNATTGPPLPSGYVRISQARMAGYDTPEATIESMLWAIHNHDLTNLLQAFAPEEAQQIQKQADRSGAGRESFFQEAAAIPGLSIVSREQMPDGSISVKAEIAPGMPFGPIRFRQINGQWKAAMGK
jgi:hypothetical protein